jgi:hypothetical protein
MDSGSRAASRAGCRSRWTGRARCS